MDQLTVEKNVTEDLKKKSEVKKAINNWVDKIKHHNLKNFGDQIQFSSILYKPVYRVDLLTRFEKRELSYNQVPFKGQDVKEQTITTMSQVKRWGFNLTRSDDDIYKKQVWSVPGSHKITTCPECSGKKKVKCPDCDHGKNVCYNCHGTGKFQCTDCGGKGHHTCSQCNGVGYTTTSQTKTRNKHTSYEKMRTETYTETTKHTCNHCNGKGSFPCESCGRTGYVSCTVCHGKGKLTCKTCNGSAQITCPTCSGEGKVIKYIQLDHFFEDINYINCKCHDTLFKAFPKLSDLSKEVSGHKLFDELKNSFPDKYLSNFPYISDEFDNLFQTFEKIAKESKDSAKINKQQLHVYEVPVYDVTYSYQQKQYSLLIYGIDQDVYAPNSPISEFSDSLLKKAKSSYKLKQFSKSLELIEKCLNMGQENITEEIINLKEKVIKLIHRDYKFGSLLGFILSAGLFTTLIMIFSNRLYFIIPRVARFYNRIETLPEVVPWMLSGIYAISMIWFISKNSKYTIDKYGIRIKSSLFRISASVINFLIFGISIGLLIYLINSTGLLNPVGLIIGYFYEKFVL